MMRKRPRRQDDADTERVYFDDVPVRDLQENIAILQTDPDAQRVTREQRVAMTYASATTRVLLEQSEQYMMLLVCLREDGGSSAALRRMALDRARITSELFLSARREDVDIMEHAIAGMDPTIPLCVLDIIESCNVELTSNEPDEGLLMAPEELDCWLHSPTRETWVKGVPRDEEPPRRFGAARGRRALERAMLAGVSHPRPTDRATAEGIVCATAQCLEVSAAGYRSLLAAHSRSRRGARLHEEALQSARMINRLMHGTWRRTAFDALQPELNPLAAAALLKTIMESCVVLAAQAGDFRRYGMASAELDEELAKPELQSWQRAVAALPAPG